jgi:transposase
MQMQDLGLSTKEVSEKLGVSEQTVYNYVKEGKITPWNKDTWKMDGTYLFHAEEVGRVEEKLKKPGFTTKQIVAYLDEKDIKVSPSTVVAKMKSGELPAVMKPYRNIDTYFVNEEDLEANLHIFSKTKGREKFHDKKTGYFLFQPFENKETGEFARIVEWDGIGNGKALTNREKELSLNDLPHVGFQPVFLLDYEIQNSKKGYAMLKFTRPKQIRSMTFDVLDHIYKLAGPNNMRLEVSEEEIMVEVKPILLPFQKTDHRDEIDWLKESLVEGKLISRPNGIVLDSDMASFVAYGSTELKEDVKKLAEQEGLTQEEFIIQSLKEAIERRKHRESY